MNVANLPLPDHFLAQYGRSGGLGSFQSDGPLALRRGQKVLLDTPRGLEVGSVLRPANVRQARLIGSSFSGHLVRPLTPEDEPQLARIQSLNQRIYESARNLAKGRDFSVLDVEIFFDARRALIHFLGSDAGLESLTPILAHEFGIEILWENNHAPEEPEPEPEGGGCGKPDCGKTEGGGGCSSCGTGGCGSCGVDVRPYFAHLRTKMEDHARVPLL